MYRQIDDGSGIENTLKTNRAIYHKKCRDKLETRVADRMKKQKRKQTTQHDASVCSPVKKTRSNLDLSYSRQQGDPKCVCCTMTEAEKGEDIHRSASTENGEKLLTWAKTGKNWTVLGRLNTCPDPTDTTAADIYYHISCYTELKNNARSAERAANKSDIDQNKYDHLVYYQLIEYVRYSSSPVIVSDLIKMYHERCESIGSPWKDKPIKKSTRFKDDILDSLGPNWVHEVNKNGQKGVIRNISRGENTEPVLDNNLQTS